jgi:predicted metal-dependent phosphoesterase TrpH
LVENSDLKLFDLHIHSKFSHDSTMAVVDIIRTAKKRGLSGIAITDHGTIAGGLAGKQAAGEEIMVIVGAEYSTSHGHILGLFLQEEIPASEDAVEIIAQIHGQEGLAVLAHPYKYELETSSEMWDMLDAIEIFNSRAENLPGHNRNNAWAGELAAGKNLAGTAGSDAHFIFEIGRSGWMCEGIEHEEDLYHALKENRGAFFGRKTSPFFEGMSQLTKAFKLRQWRRIPKSLLKIPYMYLNALRYTLGRKSQP